MLEPAEGGQILVTGTQLRSVSQVITNALETLITMANQYRVTHEDALGASWGGGGATSSMTTAGRIEYDLTQASQAGMRLSNGLIQAAQLMEQHEEDAARELSAFQDHTGGGMWGATGSGTLSA